MTSIFKTIQNSEEIKHDHKCKNCKDAIATIAVEGVLEVYEIMRNGDLSNLSHMDGDIVYYCQECFEKDYR